MTVVKITGLTIRAPKERADGTRVLAHFDCELFDGSLALRGCSLVKTAKNGFTVWAPRAEQSTGGVRSSVEIKAPSLIAAMMAAARDVYRMMGGTDAEWAPHATVGPE